MLKSSLLKMDQYRSRNFRQLIRLKCRSLCIETTAFCGMDNILKREAVFLFCDPIGTIRISLVEEFQNVKF